MSNAKTSGKGVKADKSVAAKELNSEDPQHTAALDQSAEATAAPRRANAAPRRRAPRAAATGTAASQNLDAVLGELRRLRDSVETLRPVSSPAQGSSDADLEQSVASLRRLLSELIEQRMESVVKEIANLRRETATVTEKDRGRVLARFDELLEKLGAVRFDGEQMDLVDPLIHEVVDERRVDDAPDGVIVRTVRPGYRTARGAVVCKAAVAINRRA